MKGVNEVNERNDDRLERIVGLLRKRVAACDQLIDEARYAGKRIDAGILLHRREEAKAILATVLEIVEANVEAQILSEAKQTGAPCWAFL
jgi:hypothetical protein